MWECWEFLTTGSIDDIAQLSVFPLAKVILFHAGGGFGCLHLRTPEEIKRAGVLRTSCSSNFKSDPVSARCWEVISKCEGGHRI